MFIKGGDVLQQILDGASIQTSATVSYCADKHLQLLVKELPNSVV